MEGWGSRGYGRAIKVRNKPERRWTIDDPPGRVGDLHPLCVVRMEDVLGGDKVLLRRGWIANPRAVNGATCDPEGRGFVIMNIDIHELKDGKLVNLWHIEDWATAMQQMSGQ